ncbi:TPM domain-containing protein [Parasphingorhabdus sp.]|jgi:putative membrane protein|uniref:TPM domain-containing protein n=1 Tax=Parasphingorhabdus sp. TaxID=2709688 RepID=UPI003D29437C
MAKVNQFTPEDHIIVTSAVSQAEKSTDGEIVTIVTETSDHYGDIAWAISGLVALTALLVVSLFPEIYLRMIDWFAGGWTGITALPYWALFVIAALKFFGTRLILIWKPLLFLLIPPPIKNSRVRSRATSLFRVSTDHRTVGRTGILLYLSMREHRAEIVADAAIVDKVAPEIWGDAMVALIDLVRDRKPGEGMAEAVKQMGVVLSEHFPKSDNNPNELPDRLIEL